jgi:hypothetical protein
MKIIDLYRILYPMVSYYPNSDSFISFGLSSDLMLVLSKQNSSQNWYLYFIERGIEHKNVLYFDDEYIACLEFLKNTNKIISNIPNEMKVLDYREGLWFLLEQQQEFYLDVNCTLGHDSYSWTIKLDSENLDDYRAKGKKSLDNLANAIDSSRPLYSESIFHSQQINENILAEINVAIISFNQHKEKYIKKYYKVFEKAKTPPQRPKPNIFKKYIFILSFLFVIAIILQLSK